jgi:hypothetical protein
MKGFLILVAVFAFTGLALGQQPDTKSADSLKILSVQSHSPIKDGIAAEFIIEVAYVLETKDEAMINFGFNTDEPGTFRMVGQKKIAKGAETITLKAKVTPKDWKERGDFMVMINLMPYPMNATRYRPTVIDQKVIEFQNN